MSLMMIVIWCVVLLACVGAILWAYMNVRARRIVSRLGAFRCWSRPDVHAGWTAGIGVYGVEELSWYRLVGLGHGGLRSDCALGRRFRRRGAPGVR